MIPRFVFASVVSTAYFRSMRSVSKGSAVAVFAAILVLLICLAPIIMGRKDASIPIRLERLVILTNTPYVILSMPKIRETYALTKNAGLPIHMDEHYWKWSGSNRAIRALPDNVFWTETNGMSFAHIPLEKETGQYQLEYFMHRQLWFFGKHIGPRFSQIHFVSLLIPSADVYRLAGATNGSDLR